jgi:hypothetical protein
MTQRDPKRKTSLKRDILWTVILWSAGVGAAVLLTLPFRMLISAISSH